MNCYRTNNNKFFNAPPRMDDGRHFTDYRPSCDVNNSIRNGNNLTNSFLYRKFLTENAEKLIEIGNKHAYSKNGLFKCKTPYEVGTMLPEAEKVICDSKSCRVVENVKGGLGLGRIYTNEPNPLLDPLSEPVHKLEDNKCLQTLDTFNYYPLDKTESQRYASIGGGKILSGGDPNVYN